MLRSAVCNLRLGATRKSLSTLTRNSFKRCCFSHPSFPSASFSSLLSRPSRFSTKKCTYGCRCMSSSNQDKPPVAPEDVDMYLNKQFNSTDGLFEFAQADPDRADPTGRVYHYAILGGVRVLYASIARLAVIKAVHMLSASADVLALAKVEVDISKVAVGRTLTVKWRGKPVFIRRRTPEEIASAEHDDNADLRDKQKDSVRVKKPEWLIVIGICTHLGCVPITGEGAYKGWYCPCHGSHYDTSGRIRMGPAPLNLEIPEYEFLDSTHIVVG